MGRILIVLFCLLNVVVAFLNEVDTASLQNELMAMKAKMTQLQQTIDTMQSQISTIIIFYFSINAWSIISKRVTG